MSIPSISFWRQDVNWYIQQQSWTKSFYQTDQNWTMALARSGSSSSSSTSASTNQSAGSASIADQKMVTLVNSPSESPLTGALQASGARSGAMLNLVT